jgi:hypothetical protein
MILALTRVRTIDHLVLAEPSLLAWWKGDETSGSTMFDSGPGGHNATYTGSQTLNQPPLRVGSTGCVQMTANGNAAGISSTGIQIYSLASKWTLACVVKKTGGGSVLQKAFGYGPGDGATERAPCVGYRLATSATAAYASEAAGTRFFSPNATAGSAVFLAIVKTGTSSWAMYENGTQVNTDTAGGSIGTNTQIEMMGSSVFAGSYGFIGYGSDFMLFTDDVSASLLGMAKAMGLA